MGETGREASAEGGTGGRRLRAGADGHECCPFQVVKMTGALHRRRFECGCRRAQLGLEQARRPAEAARSVPQLIPAEEQEGGDPDEDQVNWRASMGSESFSAVSGPLPDGVTTHCEGALTFGSHRHDSRGDGRRRYAGPRVVGGGVATPHQGAAALPTLKEPAGGVGRRRELLN